MEHPTIVLGVDLMDDDHRRLELMLETAATAGDDDLPRLYRDIAEELAAHFSREEDLMQAHQYPGLHCHRAQHTMLVAQLSGDAPTHAPAELRRRLTTFVPQAILSHIATMDRMTAAFLKGDLAQGDFDVLRMAVPGSVAQNG